MAAKRRCYFDRILSSLFRRLALGIIILIFIEQCQCAIFDIMAAESTFAVSSAAVLVVAVLISACCRFGCRCSYHDKFRYGTITYKSIEFEIK